MVAGARFVARGEADVRIQAARHFPVVAAASKCLAASGIAEESKPVCESPAYRKGRTSRYRGCDDDVQLASAAVVDGSY